jgi:HEAT repeat protein
VHGRISGAGAIAVLENALDSADPCVRRVAAKWLGRSEIGNPRLIQLLEGNSPRVREAAAYAIGESDRERRMSTRSALEKMLQSGTGSDGAIAAWALGELRDSASAPPLEAALKSRELGVRLAAIHALGELRQMRSLKLLERLVRSDSHEAARARAARAVGQFEDSSSMTVLAEAISDPSPVVQYAAIEAMEDLDDIEVAPAALVKASRAADARLQELAVLALARIHDSRTLEELLSHVGHANRDVRMRVAEALGEIASPKGSPGLMKLLRDPDPEVRKAAVEALGGIEQ